MNGSLKKAFVVVEVDSRDYTYGPLMFTVEALKYAALTPHEMAHVMLRSDVAERFGVGKPYSVTALEWVEENPCDEEGWPV